MKLSPTELLRGRFSGGVIWNLASLVILALSGIVINVIVARFVGAEALGVFNQVFAVYIFLSQICVGGLHLSVLKHVSYEPENRAKGSDITSAGLALAAVSSALVCIAAEILAEDIGGVLDSDGVAVGLYYAIPGLFFFALNKVLLGALNGADSMRSFAVFNALRFVLIMAAITGIIASGFPSETLAASLTLAEATLFVGLAAYVHLRLYPIAIRRSVASWFREHVSFGFRGFLSGVLSEVNTRVDVLMLGYFLDDATVGIYSFAAILAEGFSQIPFVVRRSVDPVIGQAFAKDDRRRIEAIAAKLRKVFYPVMVGVGVLGVIGYPIFLDVMVGDPTYRQSWGIFAVLLAAIVLNSGYRPFLGITLQGGRPGTYTFLVAIVVLTNVVVNALLIPHFEMYGAATGTACAYVVEAILVVVAARVLFGVRL